MSEQTEILRVGPDVPRPIYDSTVEILGRLDPAEKIACVGQALYRDGKKVIRGAVFYRIAAGFTFVGYVAHDLEDRGLSGGAELRWSHR